MKKFLLGIGAVGALSFSAVPVSAPAIAAPEPARAIAHPTPQRVQPVKPDDVPAPPIALLFAIGAVGILWGRQLNADARRKHQAKGD